MRDAVIDMPAELVDRLIELYCDWRTASADVHAAYARYEGAAQCDRVLAFAAYTAALDQEQSASHTYAKHLDQIKPPG